jgi:N-acylneuraminate cytidylyltransferase/CMP-N,N'-diacetyllegionaminic acid synthase
MKVLAVIPARGGSKAIPDKNIKTLGGKPLIAWTILTALEAGGVRRVIVSTDSHRIAETARAYGAQVPFLRPAELAQDDTPGIVPILHAAQWCLENESYQPDYVLCLQPTSPFRTAEDIDQAIELAREKEADSVVSVTPVEHHPNWMQLVDSEGKLEDFIEGGSSVNKRQDMPPVYALNGAIYLVRLGTLLEHKTFFTADTYAYIMPPERSMDIDTPWEMHLAELVMKDRCG